MVRVPAGTVPDVARASSAVFALRSVGVTGPIVNAPSDAPVAPTKVALTVIASVCEAKPPSWPDSVTATPPASISGAAPATLMVWKAVFSAPSGPPAKKFLPPPSAVLSSAVRNAGAPYCTTAKGPVTVQPAGGALALLSGAPALASAPGLTTRFPAGTAARAGGRGQEREGEEARDEGSAHRPTLQICGHETGFMRVGISTLGRGYGERLFNEWRITYRRGLIVTVMAGVILSLVLLAAGRRIDTDRDAVRDDAGAGRRHERPARAARHAQRPGAGRRGPVRVQPERAAVRVRGLRGPDARRAPARTR